jgi:hypothetical protein
VGRSSTRGSAPVPTRSCCSPPADPRHSRGRSCPPCGERGHLDARSHPVGRPSSSRQVARFVGTRCLHRGSISLSASIDAPHSTRGLHSEESAMAPRKQNTEARTERVAGQTVVGLFADQPAAERGIQAGPGVSSAVTYVLRLHPLMVWTARDRDLRISPDTGRCSHPCRPCQRTPWAPRRESGCAHRSRGRGLVGDPRSACCR